jgi:hypothetical protein
VRLNANNVYDGQNVADHLECYCRCSASSHPVSLKCPTSHAQKWGNMDRDSTVGTNFSIVGKMFIVLLCLLIKRSERRVYVGATNLACTKKMSKVAVEGLLEPIGVQAASGRDCMEFDNGFCYWLNMARRATKVTDCIVCSGCQTWHEGVSLPKRRKHGQPLNWM